MAIKKAGRARPPGLAKGRYEGKSYVWRPSTAFFAVD